MIRLFLAFVLLCNFCQAVELDGPSRIAAGSGLVRIASGQLSNDSEWTLRPPIDFVVERTESGTPLGIALAVPSDATYLELWVQCIDWDNKSSDDLTIAINGSVDPIDPVDPIVESGPRQVLLVRESTQDNIELASLVVTLRKDPAAEYLRSHNHELFVMDRDDKLADGRAPPILETYSDAWGSSLLPNVTVIDPATETALATMPITTATTADDVLKFLKKHGG